MAPATTKNYGLLLLGGLAALGAGLYFYRRRGGGALGYSTAPSTSVVPKFHRSTPIVSEIKTNGMKVQHRRSARMPIEERVANIQDMVWESIQDPAMRKLALAITRKCKERDEICEAKAIYDAVKDRIRYTGDIAPLKIGGRHGPVEPVDLYQSARRTWEFGGGDCLPVGTLLLTENGNLTPIQDLIIGSRIWGRDDWTTVKDVWAKGEKSVDTIILNNETSFKATPDHKVYVALCGSHGDNASCACPIEARSIERIRVAQLDAGMVMLQPKLVYPASHVGHPHVGRSRLLRVEKIERGALSTLTYDLSTEDHYVYLPEADVTVSNCDDHSILLATLLTLNGITARVRVTAETPEADDGHIYPLAIVAGTNSKTDPKKWLTLAIDSTLPGRNNFGREVKFGRKKDFAIRDYPV